MDDCVSVRRSSSNSTERLSGINRDLDLATVVPELILWTYGDRRPKVRFAQLWAHDFLAVCGTSTAPINITSRYLANRFNGHGTGDSFDLTVTYASGPRISQAGLPVADSRYLYLMHASVFEQPLDLMAAPAQSAVAGNAFTQQSSTGKRWPTSGVSLVHQRPPIGQGLPVVLAVGGLLLGFKLWERGQKVVRAGPLSPTRRPKYLLDGSRLCSSPVRSGAAAIVVAAKAALVLAGAVGALAFVSSSPARADLVFAGSDVVGGSGFGNLPRALTIQSNSSPESGCVAPKAAACSFGICRLHHGQRGGTKVVITSNPRRL